MKNKVLESIPQQSLSFLNDKLTQEQCKELQKIMNVDPKLYRKVFIYRG